MHYVVEPGVTDFRSLTTEGSGRLKISFLRPYEEQYNDEPGRGFSYSLALTH